MRAQQRRAAVTSGDADAGRPRNHQAGRPRRQHGFGLRTRPGGALTAEPGRYVTNPKNWRHRPGYTGFSQIRKRKRPASTQSQYDGKVSFWLRFNELGDGEFSYDPLCVTFDKFDLASGRH